MSKLKSYAGAALVAAALVGTGAAAAPAAAQDLAPSTAGVAVAPLATAVQSGWQSVGIYVATDCRERAERLNAHGTDAYCYWHPPLLLSHEELMIYVD